LTCAPDSFKTWVINGEPRLPHDASLIAIVAVGFVLASIFGYLADRLRLPALVGYLVAGVFVGPTTPASWPTCRWQANWPRSASSF
jgi:Kef-type K+ transport system membrane component KefB